MAPKQSIDTQQPTKSSDHIRLEVRATASWEKTVGWDVILCLSHRSDRQKNKNKTFLRL